MNHIFKNAVNYSIGNYSSKFIAILIFPIIVSYLGFEDTGELDLIISTVALLTTVFSLQIGDAIYRWFNTKDITEQQISFSNGIIIMILMVVVTTIVYAFVYYFYSSLTSFLSITYLILMSQIILSIFLQLIRAIGNVTRFTVVGIVKSVLFTITSLLVVVFTENKLYNTLLVLLGSNIICIILSIWGFSFTTYFRDYLINFLNAFKLIKYSTPLILNALSWASFFTINKYIIVSNLGISDNGVFAVAERLSTGIFFLGMFYYYSLQDHCLSNPNFKEESSFFKSIIIKVILISVGSVIMVILGSWIIFPLYFPDLVASLKYLPWLAFSNLFIILAGYLGITYNYKKQTLLMALTSLTGVVISILLSLLLVSRLSVHGVCISILIGTIFVFVTRLKYTLAFFKST